MHHVGYPDYMAPYLPEVESREAERMFNAHPERYLRPKMANENLLEWMMVARTFGPVIHAPYPQPPRCVLVENAHLVFALEALLFLGAIYLTYRK